jgi:plasmid stability protein
MAILNIRNLPADVHAQLRLRAARHGRSMEAEAREILARACRTEGRHLGVDALQAWVDRLYGKRKPKGVAGQLIAERRRAARDE